MPAGLAPALVTLGIHSTRKPHDRFSGHRRYTRSMFLGF